MRIVYVILAVVLPLACHTRVMALPGDRPRTLDVASDAERLTEPPAPFKPRVSRSEADDDRAAALTLFAAARMKEQKQEFADALRYYQRALRRDPHALAAAREIVPLAFSIGRPAEAVRYALKAAQLDGSDPTLLRRLAVHLTTQGEFEQALSLYEKVVQIEADKPASTEQVVLAAQMAKLYVVTGKYPEAAKAYRQVLAALEQPDAKFLDTRARKLIVEDAAKTLELLGGALAGRSAEAGAYDLIGLVLLEADDLDGAAATFAKANQLSPNDALDGYQQAQVSAKRGDWNAALAPLQKYLDAHLTSRGTAPYELLGKVYAGLGQPEHVLARLETLHKDDAQNVVLGYYLAEQYRQAGDLTKAESLYVQCVAARPSLQGYRGLIDIYHRNKAAEPLLKVLVPAIAQVRSLEMLGEEGKHLAADTELTKQILAAARTAQAQAAFNVDELTAIGQLALDTNQFDSAAEFFELALKLTPEKSNLMRRWGLGLLLKERYAEAATVLQRAIGEQVAGDELAEFHYHLAAALELSGHTDDALVAARAAAEKANLEKLGDSYYRLIARPAWVLYHAKRREAAQAEYEALLVKFDKVHDNEQARDAARDARLMLSNIAVYQARVHESEEWLEQILDEFPDDVSAMNDLGYLWVDQGKFLNRALGMIQKAVAAEPNNAAYLDSLGWAQYRQGRFSEAVESLTKAVSLESEPDGVMLDHLGDAAHAAGQSEQARAAWERARLAFEKSAEMVKMKAVEQKLSHEPTR